MTSLHHLNHPPLLPIPNHPSNPPPPFTLLSNNPLINLNHQTNLQPTPNHILQNPNNLHFNELQPPILPPILHHLHLP
ncbi:MetQ/NlpA family ABC transporter substrate-binding protein, partial [Paenibacillus sp. Y412MC10]|uniref:MetQ/NlpA family ABC transporter substrate-binding protein n=1 Tax=Geobacillus sp. (strain Y412MC10) TaxID=481743 RepID=UPI0037C599EF